MTPTPNASHTQTALRTLIWAALGVVFGDVGTSPLYAMSETVSSHLVATRGMQEKTTMELGQFYGRAEVLGWTSLFFWAIAIVVSLKYVTLIMRADNQGEGGMFSILALLKSKTTLTIAPRTTALIVLLAVVGSGLVLGDGVITPSLSIMSAWEGLEVVTHTWSPYIPALSVATLIALFGIQRFGTARVGAVFAPVMALWFGALAVMGLINLCKHPEVLAALNPLCALRYVLAHPRATLFVIGSVDLCITGCEALYADMGHFGRPAVRRAWYFVVWPSLTLNYLGQGARLLDPAPIVDGNVFFALVPSSPRFVYPLVVLSWLATIIASQALISGAFSLVRQAIQLGLFPRTAIVHTNPHVEGQIYIPQVNWIYLTLCIALVLGFKNSHNLAPAYGLAVTGTMAMTTLMFYFVAVHAWGWNRGLTGAVCGLLIALDLAFFLSNATQFFAGGYITILIAAAAALMMFTWKKGRSALAERIASTAMPLPLFLHSIRTERPHRVPGTAVFMSGNAGTPPALLHYFKHAKTLHEQIVLLRIETKHVPEVEPEARIAEHVDHGEGVHSVGVSFGFIETPDVPRALEALQARGVPLVLHDVSYFLGRETLMLTGDSQRSSGFHPVASSNGAHKSRCSARTQPSSASLLT
jgi:KUP system potassium uptake protein